MRSSFFGLSTLLRALQAQQNALDTTNHNIGNANTEGYSRQTVNMTATQPFTNPGMNRPGGSPLQIGTGVVVDQIKRQRDAFIDLELRQQLQNQARWDSLASGLQQVEGVFTEPGDHGLQSLISNYFNSWSELSNQPQSNAARALVRAEGEALTAGFRDTAGRLTQTRQNINDRIALQVPELNDLGSQVASLNAQIMKSVAVGDTPNDLRDKRDLLLDKLAKMADATYREQADGSTTVAIGGRTLVTGDKASLLTTERRTLVSGTILTDVKWSSDLGLVDFTGGEIKGYLELRDSIIPEKIRQLDLLATQIVTSVNSKHKAGFGIGQFTGASNPFFDAMMSVTLASTGLGDQLSAGTITIGGTTITIAPNTQSFQDVMTAIQNAINAATGNADASASAPDPDTGKITLTYTGAVVTLGASSDTSNFLTLAGLRGAATTTVGLAVTVVGTEPVALISARNMQVDATIKADLSAIATAAGNATTGLTSSVGSGDNRNALSIAGLQRTRFTALGDATFEDNYASNIAALGVETRQAEQIGANQQLLTEHLEMRRESTSGVSLDEEAVQLIRYQRAYQAAARGISALDELLQTVISSMGRVGL